MEFNDFFQALFALIVVLSLIGIITVLLNKFGLNAKFNSSNKKDSRIKIDEIKVIDPRRKIIIVKIDDVEHNLLLSQYGDIKL